MQESIQNAEVVNNEKAHRFEMALHGEFAIIPYNIKGDMIELFHTEVPGAFRGLGLGKKIALYALNYAKDNQLKILPYCPFIAKYINEHPEWKQYVKKLP
jgi:predicted GNAT family acetyltransferase